MSEKKYCFRLRPDMPPGFVENKLFPELPAMNKYLSQFNGKTFSLEEFDKILKKFKEFLKEEKVPVGEDEKLREGLYASRIRELPNYAVFCHSDGHAGICAFGELEPIK